MNILISSEARASQDLAQGTPRGPWRSQSSLRTRVSGDYHAGRIFITVHRGETAWHGSTGCLLIPNSFLHFATSSLLHLKEAAIQANVAGPAFKGKVGGKRQCFCGLSDFFFLTVSLTMWHFVGKVYPKLKMYPVSTHRCVGTFWESMQPFWNFTERKNCTHANTMEAHGGYVLQM